jgi:hypothetical protein
MEDSILDVHQRELRVRTWYAVMYLELTLCLVTGRPTALLEHDNPGPVPRTDGFPDAYYSALMRLWRILAEVQRELYSGRISGARRKGWKFVQESISHLSERLEHWKSKLPTLLNFETEDGDVTSFVRQVSAAASFFSPL